MSRTGLVTTRIESLGTQTEVRVASRRVNRMSACSDGETQAGLHQLDRGTEAGLTLAHHDLRVEQV